MVQIFREGGAHAPAVITTTDTMRFTTHLHTVPHGPRCSKNGARLPPRLPIKVNCKIGIKDIFLFFWETVCCRDIKIPNYTKLLESLYQEIFF